MGMDVGGRDEIGNFSVGIYLNNTNISKPSDV